MHGIERTGARTDESSTPGYRIGAHRGAPALADHRTVVRAPR
ncbi:hypothetical protein [Streptomyces sp. NPDC048473]